MPCSNFNGTSVAPPALAQLLANHYWKANCTTRQGRAEQQLLDATKAPESQDFNDEAKALSVGRADTWDLRFLRREGRLRVVPREPSGGGRVPDDGLV